MDWEALKKTGLFDLLSPLGRRISLPQGIFYWSGKAKEEADINATIGTAMGPDDDGNFITFHLPRAKEFFSELTSEEIFPYAPIAGLAEFRDGWREWILYKASRQLILTRPVITPGITGALHITLRLFVPEGGTVLSPDRFWGNYTNIIERNIGAKIRSFPFFDGECFNLSALEETVRSELKNLGSAVLLLNFPNNPTGYSPDTETHRQIPAVLSRVVEESGGWLVVLCDDAYEGFTYEDNVPKQSVFYGLAGLHPRIVPVKLDGVSKELLFYGARIGAITFGLHAELMSTEVEEELEEKLSGLIRSTVSNSPRPLQFIALRILSERDRLLRERSRSIEILAKRYRVLKEELKALEGTPATVLPFNSGFFCFADIAGANPEELAEKLLKEFRTGIIPIRSRSITGIRIAFCSVPEERIPELVRNIRSAVSHGR